MSLICTIELQYLEKDREVVERAVRRMLANLRKLRVSITESSDSFEPQSESGGVEP